VAALKTEMTLFELQG